MFWPATAAVKAQDELATLGLDGRRASQIESTIVLSKENFGRLPFRRSFFLDCDRHTHGRGSLTDVKLGIMIGTQIVGNWQKDQTLTSDRKYPHYQQWLSRNPVPPESIV